MTQIRQWSAVPTSLLLPAKQEAINANWTHLLFPDTRSQSPVFKTSTAIHLRVHDAKPGIPHTVATLSEIVECVDTVARPHFPKVERLVEWLYREVQGTRMGRIMLVKISPWGKVPSHVDPGEYFRQYFRFHIPLLTNENVVFTGPEGSSSLHLPEGIVGQLLNRNKHGVENNSPNDRIHLIADISSNHPKFQYMENAS